MPIEGHASPEGTARYAARMTPPCAPEHFRQTMGLQLSSLGLGSYLGEPTVESDIGYTQAVHEALKRGVNVIDAAINYRNMRSERSIGAALEQAVAEGSLARDEVFVATKGGFLPFDGENPDDPRGYMMETYVEPGLAPMDEIAAGCHCMNPVYLNDQLGRSLVNLGLQTVDLYYVHNPETQLSEIERDEFERRLRDSFAWLELQVADGRIGVYGAATWNGLRQPPEAPDHLSLERMIEIAREVGGENHRFAAVQVPYNMAMTEALSHATQTVDGEEVSLLEAAYHFGITVFTSAPLVQAQLIGQVPEQLSAHLGKDLRTDAQRLLQFVRSTPGVQVALCGMGRPEHAKENLELTQHAPLTRDEFAAIFGVEGG